VQSPLNYFNYFTEIEEHFQKRRGALLLLSTLDWALIETWREAGIPLAVVLRGIDDAFDKYEARKRRGPLRRINGLAWCDQAVMDAAEQQKEAALGAASGESSVTAAQRESGFEAQRIAEHLESAAQALDAAAMHEEADHEAAYDAWGTALAALALTLRGLAEAIVAPEDRLEAVLKEHPNLRDLFKEELNTEDLERYLSTLEEKLFATLTSHVPDELLLRFKTEAARELAAYRSRMTAVQLRQIEQQFVHKKLLEHYHLPRLSLFYMRQV
jgi:hypothetical protein